MTIRHAFVSAKADGSDTTIVQPSDWNDDHIVEGLTGWGAYVHTGAAQALTAGVKVSLTNNAGTVIDTQKPSDIESFYSAGKITGRVGDGVLISVELTFTPSDGTASNFYIAIDIGGAVGEIYPRDFAVFRGSGVAHKVSYNVGAYTLDTWEANGGTVKVEADGPGSVSATRYVIQRTHKAIV